MGRTPCGVRGLKHVDLWRGATVVMSHPVWGAWIETSYLCINANVIVSHPVWGAWIET